MNDIKQQIAELADEVENYKLTNRRLLKKLTDLKYEHAILQMKNNRLEAEIQKMKGEEDNDK